MIEIDELRQATADMPLPTLLEYLLVERFPQRCATTTSLRARSVVVLKMIADIDRAAPIIFCHASYIYPESVEYRARIVRLLGLTNVRDPEAGEADPLPGDQNHYEVIRSEISGGGTIESLVHLNKSLADFDCWISAAYHRPYSDVAMERLVPEGRMLRVDPLSGWSQEQVHAYMAKWELPHHPRIPAPTYHY
jgi:phosphoadenosine phosphosulfate reductase